MKVKIKEVREWWYKFDFQQKCDISQKYIDNRNHNLLTDKQLKEIYIKENERNNTKIKNRKG